MNLSSRVAGFEANLYLVLVLYHSINHQYIENSESAAVGSHGISKLSKQKLSSIAKLKTSLKTSSKVKRKFIDQLARHRHTPAHGVHHAQVGRYEMGP